MKPSCIEIHPIADFSIIVRLIGVGSNADQPITIHVDHRSFAAFWEAWCEAGFPQPSEYVANRPTIHLEVLPDEDMDECRLTDGVSAEGANKAAADAKHEPVSGREIEA
jgi:hypothetical protein